MTVAVPRHRTALSRIELSRPISLAMSDGLLDGASVFDYGCGRGDDLKRLAGLGVDCAGWDPVHRPKGRRAPADVVNLGYVINVIEERAERAEVVRSAWQLATRVLVVSARLTWDVKDLKGRPFGDGIMTAAGTFQKFYTQDELRAWLEQVLCVQPVAAAPGIFYVFRDVGAAQSFLAKRVSSRAALSEAWVSEALFERHHEVLEPLAQFLSERARLPRKGELPESEAIRAEVGSLARAFALIAHSTGQERWDRLRQAHRLDLLVYIALSRFELRPRFSELPVSLQHDVREFFSNYTKACIQADRLLFAAGSREHLATAVRASTVGKELPTALYVHRDAIGALPALLRVYEGCARALSGEVEDATVIKLSREKPQVSYLAYPDFDRDPHPALRSSVVVNLRQLTVDFRDFRSSPNPPILHRKEDLLARDDPRRERFTRLTTAEVKAGLYADPSRIGSQLGWQEALDHLGLTHRGHRLVRRKVVEAP